MDSNQNASLPQPGTPPPVPPQQEPVSQSTPATTINAPAIADDNDLIEKEWVAQVKQVLQSNAGNPYQQNRQLAALRADYLQKRYGKSAKTGE